MAAPVSALCRRIEKGAAPIEPSIHPDLMLHSAKEERQVGTLVLEVEDTANLGTPTFDAWGALGGDVEGYRLKAHKRDLPQAHLA